MSVEIIRHIVDPKTAMEIMDVKDSHGRTAQFQCGILPGHPDPEGYFQKCIEEFSMQENHLKEHVKKFKPRILLVLFLLLFASSAKAAPTVTVSASAVDILGSSKTISITVQLIDPLNTGMLRVSGTSIVPIMRASTVTPGTTATLGPIYGNDVILNGYGSANTTYYQVQVFTVSAAGIVAATPSLQAFYAFTGSGTIDLATATPLVPNFMNSTAGVSIPGNFLVNGSTTLAAPVIAPSIGPTSGQQHTLPAVASDTFALLAAAQTFVNKTLTSPTITSPTTTGTDNGAENLSNKTFVTGMLNDSPMLMGVSGTSCFGADACAFFDAAPSISSGFGTSPSIATKNGAIAFTVNVGTGGTATNGVIALGATAAHGWVIFCEDTTTFSATVFRTRQTGATNTTATIGNFNSSAAAAAWASGDILSCIAAAQ